MQHLLAMRQSEVAPRPSTDASSSSKQVHTQVLRDERFCWRLRHCRDPNWARGMWPVCQAPVQADRESLSAYREGDMGNVA